MSIGRQTSEYFKALRAEVIGALVLVAGVVVALASASTPRALIGTAVALVGALVLLKANEAYAAARGVVKAAAARRPSGTPLGRL